MKSKTLLGVLCIGFMCLSGCVMSTEKMESYIENKYSSDFDVVDYAVDAENIYTNFRCEDKFATPTKVTYVKDTGEMYDDYFNNYIGCYVCDDVVNSMGNVDFDYISMGSVKGIFKELSYSMYNVEESCTEYANSLDLKLVLRDEDFTKETLDCIISTMNSVSLTYGTEVNCLIYADKDYDSVYALYEKYGTLSHTEAMGKENTHNILLKCKDGINNKTSEELLGSGNFN